MYAANIYFWRRYRVNYAFIFGFKQGTELGYREVLLLSFCLATLALASVVSNLDMEMDPKTKDFKAFTELIPLALVVVIYLNRIPPIPLGPFEFWRYSSLTDSSYSLYVACTYHIHLPLQHHLSLKSILLPHMLISLPLCSSLQGK